MKKCAPLAVLGLAQFIMVLDQAVMNVSISQLVTDFGAALVLPALVALIAGSYRGRDRVTAYAVIGGFAGAGIAVGPVDEQTASMTRATC